MGRIERGIALTRQSWAILKEDKQLLLFPILSMAAFVLVLVSFGVPLALLVDWSHFGQTMHDAKANGSNPFGVWQPAVLFAFYFVNFFIMTFFNSALVGCVLSRFNGGPSSVKVGLSIAVSRLPQILAWTLLASTVGMVLKMLSERAGFLGAIVLKLVGVVWAIATFFVVPVLVVERVGPFTAVKRSAEIIRKTWGESIVGNLGLGIIFVGLTLLALVPAVVGIVGAVMGDAIWMAVVGCLTTVVAFFAIGLVSSTLKMILLAATYQYASAGSVPVGFDAELLETAFRPKKAKK